MYAWGTGATASCLHILILGCGQSSSFESAKIHKMFKNIYAICARKIQFSSRYKVTTYVQMMIFKSSYTIMNLDFKGTNIDRCGVHVSYSMRNKIYQGQFEFEFCFTSFLSLKSLIQTKWGLYWSVGYLSTLFFYTFSISQPRATGNPLETR